ncbi:hypothetical protein [Arhodomonas sp. SL1]|uniref:hypothetical protein n=1 Tax=Arhodomonas sp. SL1 TaxID=3425691 RepID=UPI003F884664
MAFETTAVFWVGVVLIFVYALERFNTPPTNRSSTTWLRYHLSALVYVGLFEITFALIARYPQLVEYVRAMAPTLEEALPDMTRDAEDPTSFTVGVAMLLSVLVPKVPGLARVDQTLRTALQRVAAIPHEARRLAKGIQRADFVLDPTLSGAIRAHYENAGLEDGAFSLEEQHAVAEHFHRLTAMMLTLERWEADRRFARFLQERREQHGRLRERYGHIMEMARGYSQLQQQGVNAEGRPLGEAAEKFRKGFEAELQNLILEAAELVSHTLLKCCLRSASRFAELRAMGLRLSGEEHSRMNADQITILLGALVLILLLYSALVSDITQIEPLVRVAMVPTIYVFAVLAAVLPKQHWPMFQRRPGAPPPAFGYALSGLAAVVIAFCVAIVFRTLLELKGMSLLGALAEAWARFWEASYPWLLMSFVTAVSIAAIIDSTHLATMGAGWRRRLVEAIVLGVVVGSTGAVVWFYIARLRTGTNVPVPPLAGVLSVSLLVGASLGYTVPHWYRGNAEPVDSQEWSQTS